MPPSQGPQFVFALREALSDISGMKILGAQPGLPIELDYQLAANAPLSVLDSFITPATIPAATEWQAGTWLAALNVVNATSVAFTLALYRTDANGNILSQIGSTPGVQTAASASPAAPQLVMFSIASSLIEVNSTDRILLELSAQNNDAANAHGFSIMASLSGVETSINIPLELGNEGNTFRRNKFLGFYFRLGDGAPYFDEHGVSLDAHRLP